MAGLNLSGGPTNAVEISCKLFNLPELDVMLKSFEDYRKVTVLDNSY